jgi:hypothetical protein
LPLLQEGSGSWAWATADSRARPIKTVIEKDAVSLFIVILLASGLR